MKFKSCRHTAGRWAVLSMTVLSLASTAAGCASDAEIAFLLSANDRECTATLAGAGQGENAPLAGYTVEGQPDLRGFDTASTPCRSGEQRDLGTPLVSELSELTDLLLPNVVSEPEPSQPDEAGEADEGSPVAQDPHPHPDKDQALRELSDPSPHPDKEGALDESEQE